MVPPILEYLEALTQKEMPGTEVELIDANIKEPRPDKIQADLVGISSITATISWSYKSAKNWETGKKSSKWRNSSDSTSWRSKKHADAVCSWRGRIVWREVLNDAKCGNLKPFLLWRTASPWWYSRFLLAVLYRDLINSGRFLQQEDAPTDALSARKKVLWWYYQIPPCGKCSWWSWKSMARIYFKWRLTTSGRWHRKIDTILSRNCQAAQRNGAYGFSEICKAILVSQDGDEILKQLRRAFFSYGQGGSTSSVRDFKMYHATSQAGMVGEEAIKKLKKHGIRCNAFCRTWRKIWYCRWFCLMP